MQTVQLDQNTMLMLIGVKDVQIADLSNQVMALQQRLQAIQQAAEAEQEAARLKAEERKQRRLAKQAATPEAPPSG